MLHMSVRAHHQTDYFIIAMVKSKELKLLRKTLEKADKVRDPLEQVARVPGFPFDPSSEQEPFTLHYATAQDLLDFSNPEESNINTTAKTTITIQQCLDLFETNMADLYQSSSWGLNMDEKRSEFSHKKTRYLLLVQQPTNELVAFVCFRFELDDKEQPTVAVLYVYEIQVAAAYRRQGLGGKLMKVIEQVARAVGLPKIMLTVFKRNRDALQFYRDKMRYRIDASSPSQHSASEDYEILSKTITTIKP